jgi:glycosyltransferase involved in cell wall biosynthesis
MKRELVREFHVRDERVTVIPFGINNAVPNTCLTPSDAKRRLGIRESEKTILFFGRITPYKGLEYLISAFRQVNTRHPGYRLIIAGRPDRCARYWTSLREAIDEEVRQNTILLRDEFIPDNETEVYFKAADVTVLPYKDIYQSGVLFLGYSFGLPAIATDVGSFRENIIDGRTGFLCKPCDVTDLARALEMYFRSDLYRCLEDSRRHIREYVNERHSWDVVGKMTCAVYADLQRAQQA